jgi:TrmH family RNA methyltransferase
VQRPRPSGAADEVIRSPANQSVKLIRSLRQRKARETERAFVVEGLRAIADGIEAGIRPRLIVVREGEQLDAQQWLGSATSFRVVSPAIFDDLADTVTPQGAIAVFPFPALPMPRVDDPLFVIADQVRDPGNLGTLMRAAAGAGATAVFLTEGTVDPYNPKVVRAAMGSHFRIPIAWLGEHERALIERHCPVRVVAESTADKLYDEVDWTKAAALIVGSEAHGVSDAGRSLGTVSARIPLAAGVESLNAGVAGAVILFEAARQRRHRGRRLSANGAPRS